MAILLVQNVLRGRSGYSELARATPVGVDVNDHGFRLSEILAVRSPDGQPLFRTASSVSHFPAQCKKLVLSEAHHIGLRLVAAMKKIGCGQLHPTGDANPGGPFRFQWLP